jgi:hypothetical protein
MTDEEFRLELQSFLNNSPVASVVTQVPLGSGVMRIANVPIEYYNPAFVSSSVGRWNTQGEIVQYFATSFRTCAVELGYGSASDAKDRVFELRETTKQFSAFDVSKLPQQIQTRIYDSCSTAAKWNRSQIVVDELRRHSSYSDVLAIYAPSASGLITGVGGMCLVLPPLAELAKVVGTGTYEEWQQKGL